MTSGRSRSFARAFTMVEVLVAAAILSILVLILTSLVAQVSKTWTTTLSRVEQFREARSGFEVMTRRLSQATLNTYDDYVDANGNSRTPANMSSFVPSSYARQSELRFLSGPASLVLASTTLSPTFMITHSVFFQAPLGFVSDSNGDTTSYGGLENLLNTWGYFIQFEDDPSVPSFVKSLPFYTPRYRYRLMEMMEPSQDLSVYKYTSPPNANANANLKSTDPNGKNWFTDPLSNATYAHVLAENVVALVILPKLSADDQAYQTAQGATGGDGMLASTYYYDSSPPASAVNTNPALNSQNQLPPLLQITMVALDEISFARFQGNSAAAKLNLGSLFQSVGDTQNPSNPGLAGDLKTLEGTLLADKLNYRVFTTTVAIKAAKWSTLQN